MTEVNRKIHVIGINSYKFEDLSFKLQNLFLETENIAVPNSYFEEIKSWSENDLETKKSFFSSNSNNELMATAKLSEPLRKDPSQEYTIRCRLDF